VINNAPLFAKWIRERGGVAVWESANLSNPGMSWSTPVMTESGEKTGKPNWQSEEVPVVYTDPEMVVVDTSKEVKRFKVGVRVGGNGLTLKVTDGGSRRIRKAVGKAVEEYGKEAWYRFDYETQEAVILVAVESVTLKEWMVRGKGK
jgi:hypothetical protein